MRYLSGSSLGVFPMGSKVQVISLGVVDNFTKTLSLDSVIVTFVTYCYMLASSQSIHSANSKERSNGIHNSLILSRSHHSFDAER